MSLWGALKCKGGEKGQRGATQNSGKSASSLDEEGQHAHAQPLASPPTVRSKASVHGRSGGPKQAAGIFQKKNALVTLLEQVREPDSD